MTNLSLKEEVSRILGLHVGDYGWDNAIKAASVQGKLNNARIIKIITVLLERVDKLDGERNAKSI